MCRYFVLFMACVLFTGFMGCGQSGSLPTAPTQPHPDSGPAPDPASFTLQPDGQPTPQSTEQQQAPVAGAQ